LATDGVERVVWVDVMLALVYRFHVREARIGDVEFWGVILKGLLIEFEGEFFFAADGEKELFGGGDGFGVLFGEAGEDDKFAVCFAAVEGGRNVEVEVSL